MSVDGEFAGRLIHCPTMPMKYKHHRDRIRLRRLRNNHQPVPDNSVDHPLLLLGTVGGLNHGWDHQAKYEQY